MPRSEFSKPTKREALRPDTPIKGKPLKDWLSYDPSTGMFTTRRSYGGFRAGDRVGGRKSDGYRTITFDGVTYQEHHLAWFFATGSWPTDEIDHISHARDDNRLENLREASTAENCKNKSLMKNNTSGVAGVYWAPRQKRWKASIHVNRKNLHLGYFASIEDATAARRQAQSTHGYHPNHGAPHAA